MHHVSHAPLRSVPRVDRVALISVHTCPLDQPGVGDAGGMNVYIREVARRLGEMGVAVDVFTRDAGCADPIANLAENARVIHLEAGPRAVIAKEAITECLPEFTMAMASFGAAEAARLGLSGSPYDVVHSNYWMGGRVGRAVAARWSVPLVQSFHTLGKVKNLSLAPGDDAEPKSRIVAEERIVDEADQILAPTMVESQELVSLYEAEPARIRVVSPGVDLEIFSPGVGQPTLLGWPANRLIVLFAGRLQPLKGPDVAIRAFAEIVSRHPGSERPLLIMAGGPSGAKGTDPEQLRALARRLGLREDDIRWTKPMPHALLADAYRAATVTLMPSRTESFGLVALESQACGTPVVGSDAGGLRSAVRHDETGLLVPVGDVAGFAAAVESLLYDPVRRATMSDSASRFARRFDWRWVARGLLGAYEDAVAAGVRSQQVSDEMTATGSESGA